MKKIVKKIVRKKVSPIPEQVQGLRLQQFKLQGRSEFQVERRIWFQFHYDNLTGHDVGYGSTGLAIHKWDGSAWQLHAYKHSFGGPNGAINATGGPGGGQFHEDNWKADQPGEFALTPYISFDRGAVDKIKTQNNPAAVNDVFQMGMPVYVTIKRDQPGAAHDHPPAPLFPEKFEDVEVEEVVEVPDGAGGEDKTEAPGPAARRELSRQVIEWHSGSNVHAVRIELSRRQGDHWLVQKVLDESLDVESRIEVIFLAGE